MAESKNYMRLFNSWRRYDSLATIFSILSLILAIVNYEIDIYQKKVQGVIYTTSEQTEEDIRQEDPMVSPRYKSYWT